MSSLTNATLSVVIAAVLLAGCEKPRNVIGTISNDAEFDQALRDVQTLSDAPLEKFAAEISLDNNDLIALEDAEPKAAAMVEYNPTNIYTLGRHALILRALGRTTEAMSVNSKALNEATVDQSTNATLQRATILSEMAMCHFMKGEYDEAQKWIDRALELDPNSGLFHARAGRILVEAKEYEEAQVHLIAAIDLDPDLEYPHSLLKLVRMATDPDAAPPTPPESSSDETSNDSSSDGL